jgi:hypothetical protein
MAEQRISRVKIFPRIWIALALIAYAGMAFAIVRALTGDLETLIGCFAGLLYVQLRSSFSIESYANLGYFNALGKDLVRIRQHLGLEVSDEEKQALGADPLSSGEAVYQCCMNKLTWASVQIIFAWPVVKLFWGRL